MLDRKLKRRLNGLFRLVIMLAICIITVYLFPKAGSFQYEYHKGMQWRYETLNAPFDFPIYKTEDELQNEREKIMEKQSPIFFLNPETAPQHIQRFQSALHQFSQEATPAALQKVLDKIQTIYQAGIVQLPEQYNADKIHQLKIVENNIGRKVDFNRVYTLKKAYSTLSEQIKQAGLPKSVQDRILSLNLNNFLQPNLEFDEGKTTLELFNQLQHISLTEGMVQQGDVIISQSETVTPEKIKILNSLKNEYQLKLGTTETYMKTIGGQVILVLASLLIFSIFFYYSKKRIFYNNREFIFLYGLFQATILLGSLGYYQNINIFAVPVLFFIIIVNILIGGRSALYLLLSTTLLLAYYAPNSYMFAFMQIAAGIVSIFSLIHLQRRGQLILSIFFIFITYSLVYTAFLLAQEGEIRTTHLLEFLWLFVNCLLLTLTYPVIYIFERIFGYTSEITLIELSNPNHPALRNLTKKAPGTFQHSLMVANLAEEAIYRIGGNPLLTRTGALYHDIGKTYDPIFFIENQTGGINPHNQCDYDISAQHIINHVTKGVELAKKYNLPEAIINFIRTHHGKSKVKYFYNSFKNQYPDREIDESLFTYDGPDPVSRECSVVMMADAVEAASRTLADKTEENITKLVDNIIDNQVQEGRFANADITFKDIGIVKKVFIEMLTSIYHSRIAYPKLEKKEDNQH
ncbi:HD family phosphohydrolase [Odoribacter sp. Z80]|uniref:HD family phosphohydrolase n=1 Tax=Odoribacter sp. Z80 TaxID=2304575 RepID=UPI00137B3B26|nr:HDIG domain-containing metalloprotein [Odoribacter sp. Z80]NCE72335.1 HDIG domain-containing protein [Odoribacter sp. Z80]